MLARSMDILIGFPVRKTKAQKQAFRDAVQSYVSRLGYEAKIESGSFNSRNIVIGDPESARYLVTAHYDTPARLPFANASASCSKLHFVWMEVRGLFWMILLMFVQAFPILILTKSKPAAFLGAWLMIWVYLALIRIGPANTSNVNDNTSGVITLLEILRTLPENQRNKVCFVLFDLEEAGFIGSSSYRKAHKNATEQQLVLNLDCVGDGDQLLMIPTKKLKKDRQKLTSLYKACGYFGPKSLTVCEKPFAVYLSDQTRFPYGVGIAAFHHHKRFGPYFSRIHTPQDTVLEETNINILRAALTTFICRDAAQ